MVFGYLVTLPDGFGLCPVKRLEVIVFDVAKKEVTHRIFTSLREHTAMPL